MNQAYTLTEAGETIARLTSERDEAHAEVERLRRQLELIRNRRPPHIDFWD